MATSVRAPINGDVLRWARQEAGLTVDDLAKRAGVKPERITAWEDEDADPTANQLRAIGKALRQNPAFFFLPAPPSAHRDERPPDFRSKNEPGIGARLLREIGKAEDRRRNLLDLTDVPPTSIRLLNLDLVESPEASAVAVRKLLDIPPATQTSWNDANVALRQWIGRIEALGVLVFHMSRIDPNEGRGLSLYHDSAPIIVLNGAEEASVRAFTLMHELGHLISHSGGVCDVWGPTAIEAACNAFAAEVLMPRKDFAQRVDNDGDPLAQIAGIASLYGVSQSAVAVRLKTLGRISQEELDHQLAIASERYRLTRERARERARLKKGGPPHHRIHLRNLSERYVTAVLDAMDSSTISLVDATYFLEAKLSTVERMRETLYSSKARDELYASADTDVVAS